MSARWAILSAALVASGASSLGGATLAACGGTTVGGADASSDGATDGTAGDAGGDACPLPKEPYFDCDAATPDAGTCNGPLPGNLPPSPHPVGCVVYLPMEAPFCGGGCCGPQSCNCDPNPLPDAGPQWLCPL